MYCIRCGRDNSYDACEGNNVWRLIYTVDESRSPGNRYDVVNHDCSRGVPDRFNVYRNYHSMGLCPNCILNTEPEE